MASELCNNVRKFQPQVKTDSASHPAVAPGAGWGAVGVRDRPICSRHG